MPERGKFALPLAVFLLGDAAGTMDRAAVREKAMTRPLIAGNWKMNGTVHQLAEIEALKAGLGSSGKTDIALCPPATLIARASAIAAGSPMIIGGQDCHTASSGAHTGDISAEMLADAGARLAIVGHSERRAAHHESDILVRAKTEALWRAKMTAILCVGESEAQRRAGHALEIVSHQLAGSVPDGASAQNLVLAYEPIWAIGTGLTPTEADIADMHRHIRDTLSRRFGAGGATIRILYGGSVNPTNAAAILGLAGIDGALVGGASLKAADFLKIIAAAA